MGLKRFLRFFRRGFIGPEPVQREGSKMETWILPNANGYLLNQKMYYDLVAMLEWWKKQTNQTGG